MGFKGMRERKKEDMEYLDYKGEKGLMYVNAMVHESRIWLQVLKILREEYNAVRELRRARRGA